MDGWKSMNIDEGRRRWADVVTAVERSHDRVVLTRDGRPAVVLLSPADLESLEETLDVLGDPSALAGVARAEVALSHDGLDPAALADQIERRRIEQR